MTMVVAEICSHGACSKIEFLFCLYLFGHQCSNFSRGVIKQSGIVVNWQVYYRWGRNLSRIILHPERT